MASAEGKGSDQLGTCDPERGIGEVGTLPGEPAVKSQIGPHCPGVQQGKDAGLVVGLLGLTGGLPHGEQRFHLRGVCP